MRTTPLFPLCLAFPVVAPAWLWPGADVQVPEFVFLSKPPSWQRRNSGGVLTRQQGVSGLSFSSNVRNSQLQWQYAVLVCEPPSNSSRVTARRKRNGPSLELQLHSTFLQLKIQCLAKPLCRKRFGWNPSCSSSRLLGNDDCRSTTVLDLFVNQPNKPLRC